MKNLAHSVAAVGLVLVLDILISDTTLIKSPSYLLALNFTIYMERLQFIEP